MLSAICQRLPSNPAHSQKTARRFRRPFAYTKPIAEQFATGEWDLGEMKQHHKDHFEAWNRGAMQQQREALKAFRKQAGAQKEQMEMARDLSKKLAMKNKAAIKQEAGKRQTKNNNIKVEGGGQDGRVHERRRHIQDSEHARESKVQDALLRR